MTRFTVQPRPTPSRYARGPSLWRLTQTLNRADASERRALDAMEVARRRLQQTRHDARNLTIAARRLIEAGDDGGAVRCLQALEQWFTRSERPALPLRQQLHALAASWRVLCGPQVTVSIAVSASVDDWPVAQQVALIAADNLMRNAIAATRRGTVRLQASQSNRWLRLTVIDTGPGLGASDQQGLGIGLDLLRSLLDEFDGELEMNSRPTGVWAQARYPIRTRA